MCGIVGFVEEYKSRNIIDKMLKTIDHRGPDDRGVYIDETSKGFIHLGHVRLSIQDISMLGHQPMISRDENYVIVYNGEVYNFHNIREELEELGYVFKSTSDTEVILYSFIEWGVKSVDKFIGMFAFSIYDKKNQKLILFRDRAGVKPLYYYHSDDTFIFGSELKSFHENPNFKKSINKEILPFYFQFGYIPTPYSIYVDCFKLQAGHYIEYDLKESTFEIKKYWDINDYYLMDKFNKKEEEVLHGLKELLTDSFQLRMVSDVPVGVFLSGGYDSSLVTSILQSVSKEKLNTYTIGFYEKEFNEATHAKKIAQYLDTNHTEYYCTKKDMLDLIEKLPFYFDEPFADASALPTMIVSSLAKKDVTVALSADGGDEAFFGYSKYFALHKTLEIGPYRRSIIKKILNSIKVDYFVKLNSLLPKSIRQTNIKEKIEKLKRVLNSDSVDEMFISGSSHVNPELLNHILKTGVFLNFKKTNFKNFKLLTKIDFSDSMMAVDYTTFMVDAVLTKVDKATMSVSLEGREPLLDHRIVEYMARVPMDMKYKEDKGKYLLRKILYKYLPKELVDKPKSGFTIPLKEWLEDDLKILALECLESEILVKDDLFFEEELRVLQSEVRESNIKNTALIWMIMMYVMWRKKWE